MTDTTTKPSMLFVCVHNSGVMRGAIR